LQIYMVNRQRARRKPSPGRKHAHPTQPAAMALLSEAPKGALEPQSNPHRS
jgi:hypothetical protein